MWDIFAYVAIACKYFVAMFCFWTVIYLAKRVYDEWNKRNGS